jgi:hypothetical protein
VDFTDESSVKGTGNGNNRRSVDTVFRESERRSKPAAGTVDGFKATRSSKTCPDTPLRPAPS